MDSQGITKEAITELDPAHPHTYEGGGQFLLNWFKNTVSDRLPNTTAKQQQQIQ